MCEYPKGPKRNRRPRVVVDLSPESAALLREWAASRHVPLRDAPQDLRSAFEQAATERTEWYLDFDAMRDKHRMALVDLAASEEARGLALQQAETCRRQIAECEGLRREAVERANKLSRDLARLHQMTAWDHVRAAFGRHPAMTGAMMMAAILNLSAGLAVVVWMGVTK